MATDAREQPPHTTEVGRPFRGVVEDRRLDGVEIDGRLADQLDEAFGEVMQQRRDERQGAGLAAATLDRAAQPVDRLQRMPAGRHDAALVEINPQRPDRGRIVVEIVAEIAQHAGHPPAGIPQDDVAVGPQQNAASLGRQVRLVGEEALHADVRGVEMQPEESARLR